MPAGQIRNIEWQGVEQDLVNRSPWTLRSKVAELAQPLLWSASFEVVPLIGQDNAYAWRGFLAALRGRKNSFRLVAVEKAQRTGANPTVVGSVAQAAMTLPLTGMAASQSVIPAGALVSVNFASGNSQMWILLQALISDDAGSASVPLAQPLREALSGGTAVETKLPSCLMRNAQATIGWGVDAGQQYSFAVTAEEAL